MIPALDRFETRSYTFKASLGYRIGSYLKQNKTKPSLNFLVDL